MDVKKIFDEGKERKMGRVEAGATSPPRIPPGNLIDLTVTTVVT